MISSNRKVGIAMKRSCFSGLIGSCGLAIALAGVIFPLVATAQITDPIFSPVLGPAVRIISPANHQVFFAPVDIPIFAYTRLDPVGVRFTNVEFYANGTNDLGSGIRLTNTAVAAYKTLASPDVMQPDVIARLRGLWCFVWSNAPAGTYSMTAVATGADIAAIESIVRTSAPVNITVVIPIIPPPEPTNIVSIVATDPIAIAGTNSSWIWPCMTNAVPSWIGWPPTNWMSCTNWGPKAALFTVRRCGDLSTDLLVNYNIGGTASNGVDYVALPGFVDIAAGERLCTYPHRADGQRLQQHPQNRRPDTAALHEHPAGLSPRFSAPGGGAHFVSLAASVAVAVAGWQLPFRRQRSRWRMVHHPGFDGPVELVLYRHQSGLSRLR